jgi:hypothetical protein
MLMPAKKDWGTYETIIIVQGLISKENVNHPTLIIHLIFSDSCFAVRDNDINNTTENTQELVLIISIMSSNDHVNASEPGLIAKNHRITANLSINSNALKP